MLMRALHRRFIPEAVEEIDENTICIKYNDSISAIFSLEELIGNEL
jgi:hypothetical protein